LLSNAVSKDATVELIFVCGQEVRKAFEALDEVEIGRRPLLDALARMEQLTAMPDDDERGPSGSPRGAQRPLKLGQGASDKVGGTCVIQVIEKEADGILDDLSDTERPS
jgi:hypothetical protein